MLIYPIDFFQKIGEDEMGREFEMILDGHELDGQHHQWMMPQKKLTTMSNLYSKMPVML